ncbi:hypothetical protein GOODEAATRI_028169, partial [Goodea atripinnis]
STPLSGPSESLSGPDHPPCRERGRGVLTRLKITYVTSGFLYWEEVPPMRADITSACQSRLA